MVSLLWHLKLKPLNKNPVTGFQGQGETSKPGACDVLVGHGATDQAGNMTELEGLGPSHIGSTASRLLQNAQDGMLTDIDEH